MAHIGTAGPMGAIAEQQLRKKQDGTCPGEWQGGPRGRARVGGARR